MKANILTAFINQLENINIDNEKISFKVRDLNNISNVNILEKNYNIIRKVFKLPNPPCRKPKKFVSQTVIQCCKDLNYPFHKCTKYYTFEDENKKNKQSTTGFYEFNVSSGSSS